LVNSQIKWLLILLVGIVVGATGMWAYQSFQGAKPYIVEGYSAGATHDMDAIAVSEEPGGGGNGYIISGAQWREFGGPWHDRGSPPSLAWPSSGQRIRLGVIDYKPTAWASGGSVVVWYEVIDAKNKITY
jgi:hypothetical protein